MVDEKLSDYKFGERVFMSGGLSSIYVSVILYMQNNLEYGGGMLSAGVVLLTLAGLCTRYREKEDKDITKTEYYMRMLSYVVLVVGSICVGVYLANKGLQEMYMLELKEINSWRY